MREARDDRQRALTERRWRASGAAKLGPVVHIRIPQPWWIQWRESILSYFPRRTP